jgi:hypothetical protein
MLDISGIGKPLVVQSILVLMMLLLVNAAQQEETH